MNEGIEKEGHTHVHAGNESAKSNEVKENSEKKQGAEHHTHHEVKHVEGKHMQQKKDYTWMIVSGLLLVVLIASIFTQGFSFSSPTTGETLSSNDAGEKTIEYINTNLLQPGTTAQLKSVEEEHNMYKIKIEVGGQPFDSYVTKDGKLLFPSAVDMSKTVPKQQQQTTDARPVQKSDKPNVELFVMTHCPFGTQAEKGILPTIEALKGKADVTVRFVHYFMHGDKEEQETYREVCIREEQGDKFFKYLQCFLNASDSAGCLKSTGIDTAKLDTCVKDKAKTYYAADSALSQQYGVQGSPTLVINGGQADFYPRSPANALKTICDAFNSAPGECSAQLSTQNPSPGFGYNTAADAPAASCGA